MAALAVPTRRGKPAPRVRRTETEPRPVAAAAGELTLRTEHVGPSRSRAGLVAAVATLLLRLDDLDQARDGSTDRTATDAA